MSATYQDAMTERQLQDAIIEEARRLGWMHYHTHNSKHSVAGFPDLFLLHPETGRRLVIEVKDKHGTVSMEQRHWLASLAMCGIPAMVVRPQDRDAVTEVLR